MTKKHPGVLPAFLFLALAFPPDFQPEEALPPEVRNPEVNAVHRLPARALYFPFEDRDLAWRGKKEDSSRFLSLNGPWTFHWVESPSRRPRDFQSPAYDDREWGEIAVPANWEFNGFGTPFFQDEGYEFTRARPPLPPEVPEGYNPVGSYRRWFTPPPSWAGQRVILHLGAVKSAVYVHVNGTWIGYSEDSKVEAEFDITPALVPGKNLVALQVYRFSDGSYLECQDFWRISGIEREVYIYARPRVHIGDVTVRSPLDQGYENGQLDLRVEVENHSDRATSAEAFKLKAEVWDPGGSVLAAEEKPLNMPLGREGCGRVTFSRSLPHVRPWSAERPHLYPLTLTLLDAQDRPVEVLRLNIGFRTVEIRGSRLLVNGREMVIRGVNRHEHDPATGHVVGEETMLLDIKRMKELNINAVRNSHYPNHPRWYELCDEYGLYMIDEANLESHGMGYDPQLSLADNPRWQTAHLERIQRMVERSKNHPCVIIWSLGNEAGNGRNFRAGYNWVKASEPTRPVQYEPAQDDWNTDIYCPMYPTFEKIERYLRGSRPRPFIMCEYAHAMGNSLGVISDYWRVIERNPSMQGGFIWDLVDQAMWVRRGGKAYFGYSGGRDFNEPRDAFVEVNSSGDGLLQPDRRPNPHAAEAKYAYQPIKTRLVDAGRGKLEIRNTNLFTGLENFDLFWDITADGRTVLAGRLERLDVGPLSMGTYDLDFRLKSEEGREYFLNLSYRLRTPAPLLPAGHVVASDQFSLGGSLKPFRPPERSGPWSVVEDGQRVHFRSSRVSVSFHKATGRMEELLLRGKTYLLSGPEPNFWRPPTDNDFGASLPAKLKVWRTAVKDAGRPELRWKTALDGALEVTCLFALLGGDASQEVSYRLWADGAIHIRNDLQAKAGDHPQLFKYGNLLRLPADFDRLRWYGRGPGESYSDRKRSTPVGLYEGRVLDQLFPYVRPQESGNKTDVRWAELRDGAGRGWLIRGDGLLNIAALPYAPQDLDPGEKKTVTHFADLVPRDEIFLHVDLLQMGVGGLNSWGALPLEEYRIPYASYSYSYWMVPLDK